MGEGGRKKNQNVKGVGGTPGSSHANPIQKEEKRFSGRVMGSMESETADGACIADTCTPPPMFSRNPASSTNGRSSWRKVNSMGTSIDNRAPNLNFAK